METGRADLSAIVWAAALWSVRGLAVLLVIVSVLPFIRSGEWMIRLWDFPRIQLAVAGTIVLLLLLATLFRTGFSWPTLLLAIVAAGAVVWQGAHVIRYTPLWPKQVETVADPDFRLLVTNLDKRNEQHEGVARMIEEVDPEILLLIEINESWAEGLQEVRDRFDYHVERVLPDGLGLALWSRIPLENAEIRHIVSDDRPSIHADLVLEGGHTARFVGVHPTPPGLPRENSDERHDSRIRDAELVLIAEEAAEADHKHWIIAGDFNDVAWSHTTQLFRDISGLGDPRVGRGLYSTYHAGYPLLRYPIDHVFVSDGFKIASLDRVETPGSDHFGMIADLAFEAAEPRKQPKVSEEEAEEAEEIVETGEKDAREEGGA